MTRNSIAPGDAMTVLKTWPDKIVQLGITSPPYFGLRSYSTNPQIWGGQADCEHEWQKAPPRRNRKATDVVNMESKQAASVGTMHDLKETDICSKCSAWRGELGLEPTPELFLEHLVAIFREFKRVLRDDGVLIVNMGDSYWGGKGQSSQAWSTEHTDRGVIQGPQHQISGKGETRPTDMKSDTFKAKDLLMMPSRLAMALQADGWYLRSMIPWLKRNSMPESVTDRPSSAVEYLFILTKNARYYYDAEAVRIAFNYPDRKYNSDTSNHKTAKLNNRNAAGLHDGREQYGDPVRGRSRRNSDWFFESWQGLYVEDEEPLALVVNPQPMKAAHFATFPEKLVEPFIKACSSEKGQCAKCGSAWVRESESQTRFEGGSGKAGRSADDANANGKWAGFQHGKNIKLGPVISTQTLGWRPSCSCNAGVVPQIVCDIFMGAGTVAKVAIDNDRDYCGIELNADYIAISDARLKPALEAQRARLAQSVLAI